MSTNDELCERASERALDHERCLTMSFTGDRENDTQTLCDYVAFARRAKAAGYSSADEKVAMMRRLFVDVHGEPRV
jgi:hypothetical protein